MAVDAPESREMAESVAELRFPAKADLRLRVLMDRNNEGLLTPDQREELESLVELSESLALIRAKALHLLGRRPG
jgi:hypothetical protein